MLKTTVVIRMNEDMIASSKSLAKSIIFSMTKVYSAEVLPVTLI